MARANRHFLPNKIWHITHRCHNRHFLLAASLERRRWLHWLRKARSTYELSVLDFSVTCNHIHLLLDDLTGALSIPRSMQLVASRTAQEYNERKRRTGAYWSDRYHATAVESGTHLHHCIAYIALNMVRAGVVNDPAEWADCGYHHVQTKRRRNVVIDYENLMAHLGVSTMGALVERQREVVESIKDRYETERCPIWTESTAVGSREYLEQFKEELWHKAKLRRSISEAPEHEGLTTLQEPRGAYGGDLGPEILSMGGENELLWDIID